MEFIVWGTKDQSNLMQVETPVLRQKNKHQVRVKSNHKEDGRKLGGDGQFYGIDCVDGFMGVYLLLNSPSYIHQLCIAFCMSKM